MAYVPTNQDDEEAKRRAAAGNPPGAFGDTTPTSSPTHTNFVNVGDYLSKNPDASQNLGDLASNKLASQRDDTLGSLNEAKSKFGQDVQAGGTKLDQSFLDNAFSSPETFTQDPSNTAKFLALRDAAYKGPNSLEETDVFAPTQSKINALKTTGEGIGTEAGRTDLVAGLSSHPTHGKSALNQLLLQGNAGAAQKISDTAATFGDVDSQWQKFVQDAPTQVSQAKSDTDAARTATRAGLNTAVTNFSSGLDSAVGKATNERDAFNLNEQNIDSAIASGGMGLTSQQLKDLGLGDDAYKYISKLNEFNGPNGLGYYNSPVSLSSYETKQGTPNSNLPTAASVATPEQYAREAALQQMSGMDQGLPDQQEAAYRSNGNLPSVDYMGAFNKAGTALQGFDKSWQPKVAGYGPDDIAMLQSIQSRNPGVPPGTSSYYTDPNSASTPSGGYGVTPPPEGWDASQPVPYPAPTSNPPQGLTNPQWNPYTGQWEGIRLQPVNPPPTGGGGGQHFF